MNLNRKQITDLALTNGFKLKEQPDGSMALNPYVFDFAGALMVAWAVAQAKQPSSFAVATGGVLPILGYMSEVSVNFLRSHLRGAAEVRNSADGIGRVLAVVTHADAESALACKEIELNSALRERDEARAQLRKLRAEPGQQTLSAKLADFCGHMNAARDHQAAATLEFSKVLAENHELKGRSTWQPLTPELLADISQREAGKFWLAGPRLPESVIGEYEWRQGRNPDGFNTLEGGRVASGWVTHVMPYQPPTLPGTQS